MGHTWPVPGPTKLPPATGDETVDDLLRTSRRRTRSVPVRRSFVQQGTQGKPKPGPLAALLHAHDERGLDLFLLHRAMASAHPWDVTRDARVWARALGLPGDGGSSVAAVSKTWRRLEKTHTLIRRERRGRLAKITALREDGSGNEYSFPTGTGRKEWYFRVPYSYWSASDRWYRNLSLPAKAVLLISLSLPTDFVLPTERAPDWYGISVDSAERGLRELTSVGLLRRTLTVKKAPQAPLGIAQEYHYSLLPPMAQHRSTRVRRLRGVS